MSSKSRSQLANKRKLEKEKKEKELAGASQADVMKTSDEEWDKGHRDGLVEEINLENVENEEREGQLTMDGKIEKEGSMLKDSETAKNIPYERLTKIEKSSTSVTIRSLFKEWKKDQDMIRERKELEAKKAKELESNPNAEPLPEWNNPTTLRFDLAVQRNAVWSEQQKSDLIHSILYGYYVPPLLVNDTGDGKKWFLDGNQRVTTVMTYIAGNWALSKKTEDVCGHKIAGLKFNDLHKDMQDEIFDETLTIVRLKNMTTEERDKMFVKLNAGSPLSKIELTRAKHSELIESINDIANLEFFKEDLELSRKARVRFVDQEIILQIAMLMEEGKEKIKGFDANHIEAYVLRLKEAGKTLSDEMINRFTEVSAYVNNAVDFEHNGGAGFTDKEARRALKKIHVPIIFYAAEIAIKEKLNPKLFGQFLRSYLISNYSVESKYGRSCQAGSSKKEAVVTRINEMSESLNDFIEMIREADTTEEGVKSFDIKLAGINGVDRDFGEEGEEEAS